MKANDAVHDELTYIISVGSNTIDQDKNNKQVASHWRQGQVQCHPDLSWSAAKIWNDVLSVVH